MKHINYFLFFLFFSGLIFAISSSGGEFTQNIKTDSLSDNSTTDGGYSQRISGSIDVVGTSDVNKTRFGVLDFVNHPPNVTILSSPADAATSTSATVSFQFNVTDDFSLSNCSLWTNETGTFVQTQVNTSAITVNTANSISHTFASNGTYLWNIQCSDNPLDVQPSYSRFYGSNYTLVVSTSTTPSPVTPTTTSSGDDFHGPLEIAQITPDISFCAPGSVNLLISSKKSTVKNINAILLYYDQFGTPFEISRTSVNDNGSASFYVSQAGNYSIIAIKSGYGPTEKFLDVPKCSGSEDSNPPIMPPPELFTIQKANYLINATSLSNLSLLTITYISPHAQISDFSLHIPTDFSDYENNLVSFDSNKGLPTTIMEGSINATWENLSLQKDEQLVFDVKVARKLNNSEISAIELASTPSAVVPESQAINNQTTISPQKQIIEKSPIAEPKQSSFPVVELVAVLILIVAGVTAFLLFKKRKPPFGK